METVTQGIAELAFAALEMELFLMMLLGKLVPHIRGGIKKVVSAL